MTATNELNESAFDVEFMNCVIDKADNLKVLDSDSHFSEFTGVHPSKIKQGKLFLHDVLIPQDREKVMRILCKKNSPYVYLDFYIKDKKDNLVFVHCTGQNAEDSSVCRLTLADVSRSVEKSRKLKAQAKEMNHLIDLVTGGVCLFKVNQNMHIEALYLNESCCRFFGTEKGKYSSQAYRLDELIHPDDKSLVFQAIGGAMATKKAIDMDVRIKTHRDSYMWCKLNAGIQRYDNDNCPVFHAVFTDITKIKESEQKADDQTDILVNMFKNLPGPIFTTSLDEPFRLDIVSTDFMKLLGYSRTELFEKFDGDLSRLISEREVTIVRHTFETQAKTGNVIKASYSLRIKGGKHLIVVDRRRIVENEKSGKMAIGLLSDITSLHLDDDFDF